MNFGILSVSSSNAMTHSLTPGGKPSVSSRLTDYLNDTDDQPVDLIEDEFDALIERENLRISRFVWVRELDLALLILTNRRIISQTLSDYSVLATAPDNALMGYTISDSGIHWPALDADLSLRGLLMSEVVKRLASA